MQAKLVAVGEGPTIIIDKPIVLVGRQAECDIQINSRKVSRRHCCLALIDGYLLVRDLGSTNGVRINGVRVSEGKLRHGDELTIGNYSARVWLSGSWNEGTRRRGREEKEPISKLRKRTSRSSPAGKDSRSVAPGGVVFESNEQPPPMEPFSASASPLVPFPDQIRLKSDSKQA